MSGATKAITLSTSLLSKKEASTVPPPSTSRLVISRSPRRSSRAARSTQPRSSGGRTHTSTPWASNAARWVEGMAGVVATTVLPGRAGSKTRAVSGARPRESRITRRGCFTSGLSRRVVRRGSSARMVLTPTQMASLMSRSSCTRRRAASPVIQRDWPVWVAIFPSRLIANFAVTKGRPVVIYLMKTSLSCRASDSCSPTKVRIPAASSAARPFPWTRGLGSSIAICTSATPARMSASVQGGVRP